MDSRHSIALLSLTLVIFSPLAWSHSDDGHAHETGTYELLDVGTQPAVVSADQDFVLVFSGYHLRPEATYVVDGDVIRVAGGEDGPVCFQPQAPHGPNDRPYVVNVPIEGLPARTYRVEADWGEDCFGQNASIESEITIYPNSQTVLYNHESPADGDVVSGVNVIRGWACYPAGNGQIGSITYTIDDSPYHFSLPYGSERLDTAEVCDVPGDEVARTGYGGVVYWPLIAGGGDHTLTVYIDGEPIDTVAFSVAEPPPTSVPEDVGYRKGAEGQYIIDEFLGTEESVLIRWSEADQNFVIVEYN